MDSAWLRERRMPGFEHFFEWYARRLLRKSFARVWVSTSAEFPHGGYIGTANHSSWWDGFVPFVLHRIADCERPFAVMMQDDQLRRFPIFRWGGAFSVDARTPRASKPAIDHAASLAADGCGVWIFPQGAIRPARGDLSLTCGFVHAARSARVPILPIAMRFGFRVSQRPEVVVRVGSPVSPERGATALVRDAIASMLSQIDDDLADGAIESRYRSVLDGARGIDDRIAALLRPFARP